MDDPAREIPDLVNVLLKGSSSERRAAINENFAPDATLENPFFVVNTAEEIFWVYHAWSWMTRRSVTFDAEISALTAAGDLVTLSGWTHVNPIFWSSFLPVFHVKIISLVYLAKNEEGLKVITKQHDSYIWLGSIAHNIPGFQWLYEVLWRQAFGAVAVFLMQLLFGFFKLFKLAKSDDSPPVSLMGMARALLGIKNEPVVNQDDYNSEGSGRPTSGCYSPSHLTTVSEEGPAGEKAYTEPGEPRFLEEATNNIPGLSCYDSDESDDTESEAGIVLFNADGPHSIPPTSTPDAPHPAAVLSESLHAQQGDTEVAAPLVDYPSPPRSVLKTDSPPSLPSPPTSSSHASSLEPMSYSEAAIAKLEMDGASPDTTTPAGNQAAEPQHNSLGGTLDGEASAAAAVAAATKAVGSTPRSGPLAADKYPTLECSMAGIQGPGPCTDTGGRAKGADRGKGIDRGKGTDRPSSNGISTSDGTSPSSTPSPKAPGGGRKTQRERKNEKNRKVNNKKKKKSSNSGSN